MTNEPVISASNVKDIIRGLQEQTIGHISFINEPIEINDLKKIIPEIKVTKSLHTLKCQGLQSQNFILEGLSENKYIIRLSLFILGNLSALKSIKKFIENNSSLQKLELTLAVDKLDLEFLETFSTLVEVTQHNSNLREMSLRVTSNNRTPTEKLDSIRKVQTAYLEKNFSLISFKSTLPPPPCKGTLPPPLSTVDDQKVKALLMRNQKLLSLNEEGHTCLLRGEYKKAISCFDEIIQLNSESSLAWLGKARAHFHAMDFNLESLQVAQKALQLNPNNEDAPKFYKQILLGLKRIEAIKIAEQVVNAKNFPKAVETQLEKWRIVVHSLLVQDDNFSFIVSQPERYSSLINLLISKLEDIINKKYKKLETTAQLATPRVKATCEEVIAMRIEEKAEENIKPDKQEEIEGDKAEENKQLSPKASKKFYQETKKLFNSNSQLDGALEQKKKQFCGKLQKMFDDAYIEATAINKGNVERKKDSTDKGLDFVDQANYITASQIGVEGTLAIKGVTSTIRGYRNFKTKEEAQHLAQLASNPVEMQKLMKAVSEEIAEKYEWQIAKLTSTGITTLAECTAIRMVQYIGSNDGVNSTVTKRYLYWMWGAVVNAAQGTARMVSKSFAPDQEPLKKPAKERLLKGVICGKSEIDDKVLEMEKNVTDQNDPWLAAWVLSRTGIVTKEGEYFSDADCKPEKYGYRRGTKQEAEDLKYKQDKEIENQQRSGLSN